MSESRQLTPRRTPSQNRPYLSAVSHGFHQHSPHHFSGTGSVQVINETRSVQSEQSNMIYGTNISTRHVNSLLERFIIEFETYHPETQTTQHIYQTQLSQIDISQTSIFNVSAMDIKQFDLDLYYQFIYFPAQMIMCFDEVLKSLYDKMYILRDEMEPSVIQQKQTKRDKLMVAIKNLGEIKIMRDICEKQVNRLISFRGIVVRASDIIPEMKRAFFRCVKCDEDDRVTLENAKVQEPKICEKCKSRDSFQIVHNFCEFTDKQFIKFQQLPQYVPQGETPHAITVIAYDNNVDIVKPGDRVEVVGIYRVQQQKVMKRTAEVTSVYKTHLDLISYRIVDQNRLKTTGETITKFDDKDKEEFFRMAGDKDIIQNLVKSFAPSIHGHYAIKKGILAQLFGGTKKSFKDEGKSRFRSDINICLVGDPSTAKSQLLQQVYRIAPRGIYTSGRGSSAVGLTANVKRDPQTKEFILQSGALVLSDLGICCIDEFDKMDNNNKIILLEGMEQQTISIAKAGIVCQLNCRAAIISAANPIHSKYNPKKSVVENINLPPALLSRFDLIYLMLDQPQQQEDKKIAMHLLNLYTSNDPQQQRREAQKKIVYSKDILTKYITYARQYVSPKLSDDAAQKLVMAYADMRRMGANTKTITATPRQLESLIRLSEAFAKMKLSQTVQEDDVQQAIDLMKIAIQQAATDPITGKIDMDVIVTGKTSASRQKIQMIANKIKQIIEANVSKYKKKTTVETLHAQLENMLWSTEKITDKQTFEALKLLETEGLVNIFGSDKNKQFFKLAKDLS